MNCAGFNPHPANRPGDAFVFVHISLRKLVSIRTRPTGRVMRPIQVGRTRHHLVSIRTRPTGRVMPVTYFARNKYAGFQSAPGQPAG